MLQIFAANSVNISRTASPSCTCIYLSISLARYIVLCIVLDGTRRLCNHISGSLTQHFQLKLTFMGAPVCECVCVSVCVRVWLANIPYKFTASESGFCHLSLPHSLPLFVSLAVSLYSSGSAARISIALRSTRFTLNVLLWLLPDSSSSSSSSRCTNYSAAPACLRIPAEFICHLMLTEIIDHHIAENI